MHAVVGMQREKMKTKTNQRNLLKTFATQLIIGLEIIQVVPILILLNIVFG
jgi:hypothetical protein